MYEDNYLNKKRDLSEYTTRELYRLHYAIQWELLKRQWWIAILLVAFLLMVFQ